MNMLYRCTESEPVLHLPFQNLADAVRPASGGVVVTPGATAHGSTASTPGATGGIGDGGGGGGKSQNGDVDYKKVRRLRERDRNKERKKEWIKVP